MQCLHVSIVQLQPQSLQQSLITIIALTGIVTKLSQTLNGYSAQLCSDCLEAQGDLQWPY